MFGIPLARIIAVGRFSRLRLGHFSLLLPFVILVRNVLKDLFVTIIILGLIEQRLQTRKCLLQLADQVKDTANEGWLMQAKNLDDTFDKCLDTAYIQIVLQCFVKKIEIERLFRRCRNARVKKRLIQSPIKAISSDLMRRSELLDQQQCLDAGVEIRRVRNAE